MKTIIHVLAVIGWLMMSMMFSSAAIGQTATIHSSSKTAAAYDAQTISGNIADLHDIIFLSKNAMERGKDERTRSAAEGMLTDYTTIVYSLEQLASAGFSSSEKSNDNEVGTFKEAAQLNSKLTALRGMNYDTLWIAALLGMQQMKYDELQQEKENVTNSQLKSAISEAIPVVRRYTSQLRSLQKSIVKMMIQEEKEAAKSKKK
jgi:predicted outer membrane protein